MTHRPEPSASRLRAANPVRDPDIPSADSPNARALEERIVRSDPQPAGTVRRKWWTKRRALLVLIPIGIVALGASGFGLYRNVTQPLEVACHGTMALDGSVVAVPGPVRDPSAACASLWHPGAEFNRDGSTAAPVLEPCLVDGGVAVFPLERDVADACDELHIPQIAGGSDEAAAVNDVKVALRKAFLRSCVSQPEALRLVHSTLEAHGLSDWSVVLRRQFTVTYRCAAFGVDAEKREITLAPVTPPITP